MSYTSHGGKRPDEHASKSAHTHIIKDPAVSSFLSKCSLPKSSDQIEVQKNLTFALSPLQVNPIKHIIAIDGGYTEVNIKKEFPSSTITFFQFGALFFSIADLDAMGEKPFIDPQDMSKLKEIQRLKLAIPTKNIILNDEHSLIHSIRRTIYDFFLSEPDENKFINTLSWFIFEEYGSGKSEWGLSSCPNCTKANLGLLKEKMSKEFTFTCEGCKEIIYLTDVFRLHEAIDNELGAGGILGYLTTLLEQIVLIHLLKVIVETKPDLLNEILFIKDGPLAFFGQTANMHKPMRKFIAYLKDKYNIYLVGLEKSGAFVEHAHQLGEKLETNTVLPLTNDYIYKYILPGKTDASSAYGNTTYYGNKLIFRTKDKRVYVATVPTKESLLAPKREDFFNLDIVLSNVSKLGCDMYDSALIPVALANKLVSLSNHPSSVILEKFAKGKIKK